MFSSLDVDTHHDFLRPHHYYLVTYPPQAKVMELHNDKALLKSKRIRQEEYVIIYGSYNSSSHS